tara:strand:+ start:5806 stop:7947 length:2142 start_codon:yes stop_codon:yes gene_type:complete
MGSTYTTNLNLEKPGIGEQENEWGNTLNNNFDTIDTAVNAKIPTTDLLDEDNMASNSATKPASQQSIKAYVDGASVNQEQVEDIVGGMLDGDETFITVTYDDTDGNIDFTVPVKDEDDMASDSATHLATQQSIKAYVDAQVATEDTLSELNDTSISTPAAGHLLIYDNTASHWENATLTAGSNVSITNADGSITIASTDTNTQLSQEQVEDYVGGMVSGNTETLIGVTYDDGNGKLNFVVDNDLSNYDNSTSGFITATLTQEQVEDYVGGMLDGTETFISVSYDDTDGNLDFVVPVLDEDDFSSDSAAHLATQQSIKAYVAANSGGGGSPAADDIAIGDAAVTIATSTGNITVDAQASDSDIIFKGTDGGVDTTFLTLDGSNAGRAEFNAEIGAADGTASSPAYHFTGDIDTGMFLNHGGAIGFATSGTERFSIDGARVGVDSLTPGYTFEVGDPNITATSPTGNEGHGFTAGGNYYSSSDHSSHMVWNDCSSSAGTHNYVIFRYRGSTIGDIDTTNNSTVRYNTFTGAHWSQFEDGGQPELKLGTVLSTVDELMEWTHYRYTESLEGEGTIQEHENTVKIAGTHSLLVNKEIATNEDGETAVGTPTKHETAERLPKCKVSNVAADTCVYGVFAGHYEDGDTSIEALGAGIILIAQGTTVSRGDLLESAGDGTARPQSDTTIKSSTIAKVTSTAKVKEYDDGSYCVPCTLMCG